MTEEELSKLEIKALDQFKSGKSLFWTCSKNPDN